MADWEIGPVQSTDNHALLALSQESVVKSHRHAYWLDRSPDYLAFNHIQGREQQLLVARQGDTIGGILAVTFDFVYLNQQPQWIAYTGDLRVSQLARGSGLADQLMEAGIQAIQTKQPDMPVFTCVMQDNPAGLKKNLNLAQRGVAPMTVASTFKLHFFPVMGHYAIHRQRYHWGPASGRDIPEMHALWQRTQARYALSQVWQEPGTWLDWIERAPGLSLSDYLLIRQQHDQQLVGLVGLWDQRILRRVMWSGGLLPFTWALPVIHAVHLCVETPAVLRTLWPLALQQVRSKHKHLLAIALSPADPRQEVLKSWTQGSSAMWLLSNTPWPNGREPLFQMEIALG